MSQYESSAKTFERAKRTCDRCHKRRFWLDLLRCTCCDGDFCIVGEQGETCADRHEESGQ